MPPSFPRPMHMLNLRKGNLIKWHVEVKDLTTKGAFFLTFGRDIGCERMVWRTKTSWGVEPGWGLRFLGVFQVLLSSVRFAQHPMFPHPPVSNCCTKTLLLSKLTSRQSPADINAYRADGPDTSSRVNEIWRPTMGSICDSGAVICRTRA